MANTTSPHILNTAATLLGFLLFVISSRKMVGAAETYLADATTSFAAILLALSCIFSFLSLRTGNEKLERKMEFAADVLFFIGLIGILFLIILIAFHLVGG